MNFAWTCLIAEHGLMFPRFVPLVKGTNEQLMSGDSRILRRTKVQGSQRPVISGMRSPTNSRVGLASGKGQRTRGNSGSGPGIRDSHYTAVICAGRAIARAQHKTWAQTSVRRAGSNTATIFIGEYKREYFTFASRTCPRAHV